MKNIMKLVNLSFNNFISIKKIALFIVGAFSVSSLFDTQFLVMLFGITTYVVAYQTMAYEDSYGIDNMIAHLPVTKKQYVISRYVFCIAAIIGAGVLCSFMFFVSNKINLADFTGVDYKTILFLGIISSVILISISTPVLLYLGMKKGRMAMILIFMVIVMIPSMLVKDSELGMNIITKISESNIYFIGGIFVIVILLLSYFVSVFLYDKKEIV